MKKMTKMGMGLWALLYLGSALALGAGKITWEHKLRHYLRGLLILSLWLASGSLLPAQEYYVSKAGHDENNGRSISNSLATVSKALGLLRPGDTLIIGPGIYHENFIFNTSGTPEKPITIKAQYPGRTMLTGSEQLNGLIKTAGLRFVYEARVEKEVYNVIEVDTAYLLTPVIAKEDMDRYRGSWFYDRDEKKLFVHFSDGGGPDGHKLEITTLYRGVWIKPGDKKIPISNVILDGLIFRGYFSSCNDRYPYALTLHSAKDCTVKNCAFIYNGGGIIVAAGQGHKISNNYFFANFCPGVEGAQLMITGAALDCLTEGNTIIYGGLHGLRYYDGPANGICRNNLVADCPNGLYFKGAKDCMAENNIAFGNEAFNIGASDGTKSAKFINNTAGKPVTHLWTDIDNLIFGKDMETVGFADPVNLDFRLQSDSPFRGKGKQGTDLGAFQYKDAVYFVKPDGDDQQAGTSLRMAWKSLRRACQAAKSGSTVYILPGVYREQINPQASNVAFIAHGKGFVVINGEGKTEYGADLQLPDLRLKGFRLTGFTKAAVHIGADHGTIEKCEIIKNQGAGILLENATGGRLVHNLVAWNAADAIRITGRGAGHELTANVIGTINIPDEMKQAIYQDYNIRDSDAMVVYNEDSFCRFQPQSACFRGDGLGDPIGTGYRTSARPAEVIEDLAVSQVTLDSAVITWWTPSTSNNGRIRIKKSFKKGDLSSSVLLFGKTRECNQSKISPHDVYHAVTLNDLEPNTKYYCKVRGAETGVESGVLEFMTAPPAVSKKTYYIAGSGDDNNDGSTKLSPWKTIHKANLSVKPGDRVILQPGTYYGCIEPVCSGVKDAPIIYEGLREGPVIFNGLGTRANAVSLYDKSYIQVKGLTFRNFAPDAVTLKLLKKSCQADLVGCRQILFENCIFFGYQKGAYTKGLGIENSSDVVFNNNIFAGFVSMFFGSGNKTIEFRNNTFYVAYIRYISMQAQKFVMRNNIFHERMEGKWGQIGIYPAAVMDSDYNAFAWFAENTIRYIGGKEVGSANRPLKGLAEWQANTKGDKHSLEGPIGFKRAPEMIDNAPAWQTFWKPYFDGAKEPDFMMFDLKEDSPLKGAGENGADIGARPWR